MLSRAVRFTGTASMLAGLLVAGSHMPANAAPSNSAAPGLARAVANANTTAVRVKAIDAVMAALHVTVIDSATGAVVVKGAARGPDDAYLYSSEITQMALAYADKERTGIAAIAALLSKGVYAQLGLPISTSALASVLLKVEKQAAADVSGGDSLLLAARLLRDLGLDHSRPQDLAKPIPASAISLDPLQSWLLAAAFTLPVVYHLPVNRKGPGASRVAALTHFAVKADTVPSFSCHPVEPFWPSLKGFGSGVLGGFISGLAGASSKVVVVAAHVLQFIDIAHLAVIADGVIYSGPGQVDVALGSPAVDIGVSVYMKLKVWDWLIQCGYLAGTKYPKQGAIPGVKVIWHNATLDPWGTSVPAEGDNSTTNQDGFAFMRFTPKPDFSSTGPIFTDNARIDATALVGWGLGFNAGLNDIVNQVHIAVVIKHHMPPTTLEMAATTSYTYSCQLANTDQGTCGSTQYYPLNNPGCSWPDLFCDDPNFGSTGNFNINISVKGAALITAEVPFGADGTGQGAATETSPFLTAAGSASNAIYTPPDCWGAFSGTESSTGGIVGKGQVYASIVPVANSKGEITDFNVSYTLNPYTNGTAGMQENVSGSDTFTRDPLATSCAIGSATDHFTDAESMAASTFNFADATLPTVTSDWTLNPRWSAASGGVWATKTITIDPSWNASLQAFGIASPTDIETGNILLTMKLELLTAPV